MKFDKAKQLLILGNGFDLHCGLGSNYKNFLTYVITNKYKHQFNEANKDNCFEKFEDYLKNTFKQFDIGIVEDFRVEFSAPLYPEINLWYLIFFYEKLNQASNWNDIESAIEKYVNRNLLDITDDSLSKVTFLDLFAESISNYATGVTNVSIFNSMTQSLKQKKFSQLLIYFLLKRNTIYENLKKYIDDVRSEIANGFSNYEKTQSIYNQSSNVSFLIELSTNILLSELHALEQDFQDFLKYQLTNQNDYESNVSCTLRNLVSQDDFELTYNIFSFNYTNKFIYESKLLYARNVHGELSDQREISNIIFGIDSSISKTDMSSYRFTKEFRTLELYTENEEDYVWFYGIKNIFNPEIEVIKFYGHSLSEADYSYFQYIFDLYDLYNGNISLIFYFSYFEGQTRNQIKQEQFFNVSKLIEKYGETLNNKDHGKNLLTRLIQTGRLKIKLLY
ncbi:AbiH family protein [Streptococcus intermedius]